MSDETYNGWSNRETWALMLHINNDQGLDEMFHAVVEDNIEEPVYKIEESFRASVESLLTRSGYEHDFGDTWPDALADMAEDVGSLWRINWNECVEGLLSDLEYGTCDECSTPYPLPSREGRCGDCGNCADHCEHVSEED